MTKGIGKLCCDWNERSIGDLEGQEEDFDEGNWKLGCDRSGRSIRDLEGKGRSPSKGIGKLGCDWSGRLIGNWERDLGEKERRRRGSLG